MTCVEKSTVRPSCGLRADGFFEAALVDWIETGERLVEDDEVRLVRDRAEHLNLLRHALRERLDLLAPHLAEAVIVQERIGSLERFARWRAFEAREIGDG
jgi:hypothetical protein